MSKETKPTIPSASDLRKLAEEVRKIGAERERLKTIKCAKYVMGLTALVQLQNKIKSF
jgi:hypothetical protein